MLVPWKVNATIMKRVRARGITAAGVDPELFDEQGDWADF